RHVVEKSVQTTPRPPRLAIGGTGAIYLNRDKKWIRSLLRLINASDRGQVSAYTVADHLASLNSKVHLGVSDGTVGPRCIVAWRHRKGGIHKGGGGHQFYTGTIRDASSSSLPTIVNGMDLQALIGVMMPRMTKMFEAKRAGEPAQELDKDEVNAALARLPDKPDEILR
ncbi:MAG: hypothetical protein ACRDJ9_25715, partial [Dehalococcoidia bacterium]